MKKILLLVLLVLSNSPVKAHPNQNSISPILKEIPFDFSQNLPIIEVNIKGNITGFSLIPRPHIPLFLNIYLQN